MTLGAPPLPNVTLAAMLAVDRPFAAGGTASVTLTAMALSVEPPGVGTWT